MTDIKRVLVVGAGVGGLSAALAFIQRGAAVTLIERKTSFDIPGVGLGQPANALRVYDALGVLEEILAHGYVYDHMTIYDAQRRLIARHKFLLGDERIPAVCALPRSELHRILLNAAKLSGATIRLGQQVAVLDESDRERVTAAFTDGTSETFDLVAGFDGIRSATREHIWGTMFTPRFCGIGAWRSPRVRFAPPPFASRYERFVPHRANCARKYRRRRNADSAAERNASTLLYAPVLPHSLVG